MANVRPWFDFLDKWEGKVGATIVKDDKGGLTNHGVTFETWKTFAPLYLGVPGTEAAFRLMNDTQWRLLTKKGFWDVIKGDQILSQAVAEAIADYKFHGGVYDKEFGLQAVLNQLGNRLSVDGVFGPLTLGAINNTKESVLFPALIQARWNYLQRFIKKDPTQKKFEKGWYNRLTDLAQRFGYRAPSPVPGQTPTAPVVETPKNSKKKKLQPELPPEA